MKLTDFEVQLKDRYNGKEICIDEIKKYLSNPNMYGDKFNIHNLSENHIEETDLYKIYLVENKNISIRAKLVPHAGFLENIIFVKFDKDGNTLNYYVQSGFENDEKTLEFIRFLYYFITKNEM